MKEIIHEIKRNRSADYYADKITSELIEIDFEDWKTYYNGDVPVFEYGIFSDLNINLDIINHIINTCNEDYQTVKTLLSKIIIKKYVIEPITISHLESGYFTKK